jgi:hypothetical protein
MFAAPLLWPKAAIYPAINSTNKQNNKYLIAYKIKIACKHIILLCTVLLMLNYRLR